MGEYVMGDGFNPNKDIESMTIDLEDLVAYKKLLQGPAHLDKKMYEVYEFIEEIEKVLTTDGVIVLEEG